MGASVEIMPREMTDTEVDRRYGVPTNIEAEQALLGAIFRNNLAHSRVADFLEAEHFANAVHTRIFAAIGKLIERGQVANPVTLKNLFDQDGALAEIGGAQYLTRLAEAAVTIINAEDYGRRIHDLHLRRQLIGLGEDLVNAAIKFDVNADARQVVEDHEQRLTEIVGQGRGQKGPITLGQAARASLEASERAYKADGKMIGRPTGFVDLDRLIGGLLPGRFECLAGRPSMGKSSLAASIAMNVATRAEGAGVPVAYFSLEETGDEAAQRILAHRSGVASDRQRRGELDQVHWSQLVQASEELDQVPLYYDDTSGLSVSDIRTRARRLHRQVKRLGLIVVDHLQLIRPPGRRRPENRVQELSAITADLKVLAKELDVPVLALSQLSRAVEQREDKRPQLADLRECVTGDTQLINADTGLPVRIDTVKKGARVLGVGPNMKVAAGPVSDVWKTGDRNVYRLTTASGRSIRATDNHPFLTSRGWVPLGQIKEDDRVAVPYRLPVSQGAEDGDDLCRLIGYMAGNGSAQEHRTLGLIIPDQTAFDDASQIILRYWPEVQIKLRANGYNDAWISRTFENGYGRPFGNPMREWLRGIGFINIRDEKKSVPNFVFERGERGAAEFLAGYLETDGCVTNTRDRWSIRFDTCSHQLAQDTALLLARLGIAAIIGAPSRSALGRRDMYRVSVGQTPTMLRRFAEQVPARGMRARRLRAMLEVLPERQTRHNALELPPAISAYAASVADFRDQERAISREQCQRLLAVADDPVLRAWVESDFIWDRIRSIVPDGEEAVWDIRVPGINSFIGNGIAVHNSGAIEQDADSVMFLYREEYYLSRAEPTRRDNETDEKFNDRHERWADRCRDVAGLAEVIVAKRRGGPTGTVKLTWDAALTRFDSLAWGYR